ncbi:MAG: GTP cyclohydrolase II RibA [Rhizobiales bacterium]|nr:GTP cyclohydrolase II RibA [Hyphomicrobiales bacterium]
MGLGDQDVGSSLFGTPALVGITRGLAEFRAGRPVLMTNESTSLAALPVEGLNAERLSAFAMLCAPALPRLVVTTRRALAIGVVSAAPVALRIDEDIDADAIVALVADAKCGHAVVAVPAGPAAIAAIEMAKLAQVLPAVLVAEATPAMEALDPAIASVAVDAVTRFHDDRIQSLAISGEAQVPLNSGVRTRFVVFRDAIGESPVAVIVGNPDLSRPTPVRLHSACLTGDVFGSRRCDCGDQLKSSLKRLAATGGGIIIYLAQEGRGLGLSNKMRAYQLQDAGLDTVDANTTLGFDDDERNYGIAARMLQMLGCTQVVLLTNNPAKLDGLAKEGIEIVGRVPLETPINADNRRYMTAKAARSGHRLDHLMASLAKP